MADWLREEGYRKVALLYVNNSWGQGLREEFRRIFTEHGGTVVAEEACNEGDRDLRTQISKLMERSPEALYAITYAREGGALLRQARELGFSQPIYGADVWGSPELRETAGETTRGVKIIVPSTFSGLDYDAFADSYRERYGEDPDVYAAYAYDMIRIIADTAERADRDNITIREALSGIEYNGVTGLTRFDEHGDVVGKGFERRTLQ